MKRFQPCQSCIKMHMDDYCFMQLMHPEKDSNSKAVVICADDTDVFILCLAFRDNIHDSLFQKCGTQTRTRLTDTSNVATSVGPDVCKALLGMHAFTG